MTEPIVQPRADGMATTFDHVREDALHPVVIALMRVADEYDGHPATIYKLRRAAMELHNALLCDANLASKVNAAVASVSDEIGMIVRVTQAVTEVVS